MRHLLKKETQKFLSLLLQVSWNNKLAFLDFHVSFSRVIYIYSRDLFSELFSDVVFHPDLSTCSFTKDFSNIFRIWSLNGEVHFVTLTRPFYRFNSHVDARIEFFSNGLYTLFHTPLIQNSLTLELFRTKNTVISPMLTPEPKRSVWESLRKEFFRFYQIENSKSY